MKLFVYILTMIFFGTSAHAAYDLATCVPEFEAYVQSKIQRGVPDKHLPRLYVPASGQENGKVVMFIHGAFESPYFFKGISKYLMSEGFVVLDILLPGYWEESWSTLDQVTAADWSREVDTTLPLATCFSHEVVFAGHSLGALLATKATLEHPDLAKGLLVWSPAFRLKMTTTLGGFLGRVLGLSGNFFLHSTPDHNEIPYYSPSVPKQINVLLKNLTTRYGSLGNSGLPRSSALYTRLHLPVFMAYAENDNAISTAEVAIASRQLPGPQETLYFPKNTGVIHGNITKYPEDAYEVNLDGFNHQYPWMQERLSRFLHSYVK